ncbi:MAG: branched-chain amino acid ABC transporter permease [Acetanaerobacterium sp.]
MKHRVPTTPYFAACVVLLAVMLLLDRDGYSSAVFSRMLLAAVMAGGLDLCVGMAGQLSLGQAVFMAAGAYCCAGVTRAASGGFGAAAGLLLGGVCAAAIALPLGAVVLRLKGDYLAVATMGLGEIVRVLLENSTALGGVSGLYDIPRFTTPLTAYLIAFLCATGGLWFAGSRRGFLCRAMGQDETAAAAVGVNTMGMKLLAFTLAAGMTGLAGGLYAGLLGFISPKDFTFARSVDILAAVVIGGTGTIIGPMLAAMAIEALAAMLQGVANLRMILYALILIIYTIIKYTGKGRAQWRS